MKLELRSGRMTILDALRGVAASVVVFHHLFVLFPNDFNKLRAFSVELYVISDWISDQNRNAVLAFFVLSGFAIRLSLKSGVISNAEELRRYSWRRFIRIVPLYWLAIVWTAFFGAAIYGMNDPSFSVWSLLGNISFLQTSTASEGMLVPPYGRNGPFWSLSYEVFYYALLPISLWASKSFSRLSGTASVLFLISISGSCAGLVLDQLAPNPLTSFLSLWHIWMLGYYLADRQIVKKLPWLIAVSAVCFISANSILLLNGLSSAILQDLQTGALMAACAALLIFVPASQIFRPIGHIIERSFRRIGDGSYALYLLHYPVLLSISTVQVRTSEAPEFAFVSFACVVMLTMAIVICPSLEKASLKLRTLAGRQKFTARA